MGKKKGRPPGSKTRQLTEVLFTPPTCPHCGSGKRDRLLLRNRNPLIYGGLKITWYSANCKQCGRPYAVRKEEPA